MENNLRENNFMSKNVISYVNEILKNGILENASDIHLKYDSVEGMEIKYRKDGYLLESENLYKSINKNLLSKNIVEIIARIKILSQMNVAEKRKPQDGSFSISLKEKRYDIRAAYMPTFYGETIVLRILENYLENVNFDTLGFLGESKNLIEKILCKKHGLILVSGPTGSGKSTTLQSMINKINDGKKKIITVEDPVEIKINGITQVQINNEIGVTFSEILKATLRNDPDVIIISEIRDETTAQIAVRAALTGHLVISTIHTNDAISTVARLNDMKIPLYLILDSLIGVVGQRLVARKCQKCFGVGCEKCNGTGYKGRISINEILLINEDVKHILKNSDLGLESKNELKKLNENYSKKFFIDFYEDIKNKIEKNLISKKDDVELF